MGKNVHVVPDGGDWAVKKTGNERASRVFDNKSDAEKFGREQAHKEKSELVIHDQQGRIQRKDSSGNDPYPPKG